ncbi:unnamed protein product [Orchesella dallaii]|uniref:ABC transporter domain-containing protein n=1 Tax=Orchesella dallaii TaxID=48710 RepID=A0ABP1RTE3_9HEXA
MGCLLQLKLLLWKNFTLKKRKPVMLIFELLIPLTLFVVLVLIRRRKPAIENAAEHFSVKPLPSAGLIDVMQSFCESSPAQDDYNFPKYPNATVEEFLTQVNTVGDNYNFFKPGFTLDELQEVPRIYRSIIEDPIMLKEYFERDVDTDIKAVSLLKNPLGLQDFMTKNLSFDAKLTGQLIFNAAVDKRSLYKLLFHNPNVSRIFFENHVNNISTNKGQPTMTSISNAEEATKIPNKTIEDIEEGFFYRYMRKKDVSEDVFYALLGFKQGNEKEVTVSLSSLLKKILLNEESLSEYMCHSKPNVFIWNCQFEISEPQCRNLFHNLSSQYCRLPLRDRRALLAVIDNQIDINLIAQSIKVWKGDEGRTRMKTFIKHVETVLKFKLAVRDLYKVSESMPQEYCNGNSTNSLNYEESEFESTTTESDVFNSTAEALKKKHSHPRPFLQLWKAMQKTLCGADVIVHDNLKKIEDIPMSNDQRGKIQLLKHVLYSNPKILYVPSGTDADKIIQEANRTFVFFDTVTNYASTLTNVSEEIKSFLAQNSTEYNLVIIKKIQSDMISSPLAYWFKSEQILLDFLYDDQITDKQMFMSQLDIIGTAACSWNSLMRGISFNIFNGFRTEDEMLDYFKTKAYKNNDTVLAGVVFYMNDDGSLPNHMIYKIRQNATFVRDTQYIRSQLWFPGPGTETSLYYQFGFIWIQDVFERAMINLYSGKDVIEPGSYIQLLPYPCYVSDQFVFMIQHVMALCLTVSWVYSVAMLVQHIVYEKEQRLKEGMRNARMRNSIHWIAWFISAFIQMTITVSILTIILKYGKVLAYSDPWIIFWTMEIFAISIIMFSFLVSVLFSKAKIAAACAGILYFMSYVPYLYIAVREEGAHKFVSLEAKLTASFLAPTALGLAARYFAFYEEIGQGIQWSNIAEPQSKNHGCHLAHILAMLLFDAFVYLILFWYIENVHPGTFGIPKPWNFPFTKSYWLGTSVEALSPPSKRHPFRNFVSRSKWWNSSQRAPFLPKPIPAGEMGTGGGVPEKDWRNMFEDEPSNLPLGVSIMKLSKKYKNASKYAVKSLNLNLYEGQITALLGPTGSGKTTVMSILTGLYPPTSGSATIYGNDIGTHMDAIRSSLGLCPQHNVLFDELTVDEHIWFYSRLKQGNNDVDSEVEKLIVDLDLPDKRHQKVDCLSGGMKRRLSVAIAFVGGSRAIFVDEPTAGVDPVARRAIWDLILKYKKGRTILLSTHHMDEADILGDRIAIIENGVVKCCGSPLYLKNQLGEGYHLYIVKKRCESEFTSECCQQAVTAFIRRRALTVKLVKESKHELHYMLPLNELKQGNFVKLFRDLKSFKEELHISSYGVKNTTLEEIFMKVISDRLDSESEIWTSNEQLEPSNSKTVVQAELQTTSSIETRKEGDEESIKLEPISTSRSSKNVRLANGNITPTSLNEDVVDSTDGKNPQELATMLQTFDELKAESQDFLPQNVSSRETRDDPRVTQKYPVWQQFCAIIQKRYLCTKRNLEGLISQILLPSFFVSVAMSVALTVPDITELPEFQLSPVQYFKMNRPDENSIGLANNMLDLFEERTSDDADSSDIANTFYLPSGPGASCVLKTPFILSNFTEHQPNFFKEEFFDSMCKEWFQNGIPFSNVNFHKSPKKILPKGFHKSKERYYPICYCSEEKTAFYCPPYGYTEPNSFKSVTGDIVYDVSGQNESQYYLYTYDKFKMKRYGGISLGLVRNHVPRNFGNKSRSLFGKIAVRNAAKVWYDENGYHSLVTYLNVLNNAILRANLPPSKGNPAGYGMTAISHPWPNTHSVILSVSPKDLLQGNEVLISIFIIVAMSFVPASFALFVVYERYTRSSHLQLLSGVHPMTYLTANYIWDVCNYFVPASFIVAILLLFDVPAYSSRESLPAVISLFLMYGWCISPVMHCASLIFNEPSSAYIFLIVINLFVGITCIVTSFLLEVFSSDAILVETHLLLKSAFLVFPNYSLGRGLMDIVIWHYVCEFMDKTGQERKTKSPFAWEVTGKSLSGMICTGMTFFIINFIIESRRFNRTRSYKKFIQTLSLDTNSTDEDVINERARVLRGLANEDILRVENLTKVYHTRKTGKHLAVDRLCFGVPPGECFGLLGVNSAGKSSTFKMLTGDTPITFGDAFINTHSVKTSGRIALKSIGYCPQVDALLDELTAREHLQLYARLRGVPSKEVDLVVEWALKKLDLLQIANRPCRTYSGGNRRKISTAIALIGSPSLIFLDEPTSGTDPRSRRFLWDLILSLVKEGRSIVFTSHSMEECEMLCTRLAIMVNGQFRCIGSAQHLKNKFGDGYSITLRCTLEKDTGKVERYMRKMFSVAVMKEKHHNCLHYEIASEFVSLDDIFQKLELAMKDMPILDYSVSQNTLDNVRKNEYFIICLIMYRVRMT